MSDADDGTVSQTTPKGRTSRGRAPAFYRAEVEAIQMDERPTADIAAEYKVSFDTIQRVKQLGRFQNTPYIARDDDPTHREVITPIPTNSKRGRPFKSGRRQAFSEIELEGLAGDPREAREVAATYGVTPDYVNKVRRAYGTAMQRRGPLDHRTIAAIRIDPRNINAIASAYKVPGELVQRIKDGRNGDPESEDGGGVQGSGATAGDELLPDRQQLLVG